MSNCEADRFSRGFLESMDKTWKTLCLYLANEIFLALKHIPEGVGRTILIDSLLLFEEWKKNLEEMEKET